MRNIGILLIVASCIGLIITLNMDTTVAVDYPQNGLTNQMNLPDRVVNLNLVEKKQTYTIITVAGVIVGVILLVSGRGRSEDSNSNVKKPYFYNIYTCTNCKTGFTLDNDTIDSGIFVCPKCNHENTFRLSDLGH